MRLRVGAATHIGRVRVLNEDSHAHRAEDGLFVVCDGMGGEAAGEVASQMAVDKILEQIQSATRDTAGTSTTDTDGYLAKTNRLAEAVRQSNQFIYEQAQKDARRTGMGTTVVSAWLEHNVASLAHVGDSRAYLWHDGYFEALTSDHSLVEAQVRAGLINREGSLQSAEQNVLLRALGREPDVDVELNEVPVQAGDFLLLCSDGLTRMVPEPAMADAIARLRQPQRICDELIDAANRNGGADNITVIVVEAEDTWWRRLWSRWRRNA